MEYEGKSKQPMTSRDLIESRPVCSGILKQRFNEIPLICYSTDMSGAVLNYLGAITRPESVGMYAYQLLKQSINASSTACVLVRVTTETTR